MEEQKDAVPEASEGPPITITIGGHPGAGKSTLAMFIALCLEKAGIENIAVTNEDADPLMLAESFQTRLKAVAASNPAVSITMTALKRDTPRFILPPGVVQ